MSASPCLIGATDLLSNPQ